MSGVGRRYAQALFSTLGKATPDRVLGDLETFGRFLSELPDLRGAIENPGIPSAVKSDLVKQIGKAAGFEEVSTRFVLLVVGNRRLGLWDDLLEGFRALCYEKKGVLRGRVTTARTLEEKALADVAARLGKALGRPVELETSVSAELLGGMELRLGSTVYDGSVAGALRSLHRSLVKG